MRQPAENASEKLKELEKREAEQKTLEAKISLMHKRWEGKMPSIYSEGDQVLLDDETLVDYSAMVQKKACEAQEQITKSIREALALIRRYYEAIGQFDDHMLQILKREEERLLNEAREKLCEQEQAKAKGELPALNERRERRNMHRPLASANTSCL